MKIYIENIFEADVSKEELETLLNNPSWPLLEQIIQRAKIYSVPEIVSKEYLNSKEELSQYRELGSVEDFKNTLEFVSEIQQALQHSHTEDRDAACLDAYLEYAWKQKELTKHISSKKQEKPIYEVDEAYVDALYDLLYNNTVTTQFEDCTDNQGYEEQHTLYFPNGTEWPSEYYHTENGSFAEQVARNAISLACILGKQQELYAAIDDACRLKLTK